MPTKHSNMDCRRVKLTKCHVVLLVLGVLIVVLTGISILVFDIVIHNRIAKKVAITPGSETYAQWKEATIPIHVQFYVFDVQNPAEVKAGGKPSVVQRGPYTYREHRKKVDIVHNENDTITYRQIKTYDFVRNMSVSSDNDTFTTVNLPLVTLANFAKWSDELWKFFAGVAPLIGGGIFVNKTVREMVFGYHDPLLKLGMSFDPDQFYTDFVGIMAGKNDTDDGTYTIYTGEKKIENLGIIDKYNGTSSLKFWTADCANMINGSDGTVVPPFVKESQTLYMFSTDICRSVFGVYNGTVKTKPGVETFRFAANRDVMASAASEPSNEGFCTPRGNCMGAGVLNLTTCQTLDHFHVPIVASFPHFYLADPEYIHGVDGMSPNQSEHSTYVDLEPVTGIVTRIAKRLQINVHLENISTVQEFANMSEVILPILWLDEGAVLDDAHIRQIKSEVLRPRNIIFLVHYALFGVGGLLLLLFCGFLLCAIKKQEDVSLSVNDEGSGDETDPLLN